MSRSGRRQSMPGEVSVLLERNRRLEIYSRLASQLGANLSCYPSMHIKPSHGIGGETDTAHLRPTGFPDCCPRPHHTVLQWTLAQAPAGAPPVNFQVRPPTSSSDLEHATLHGRILTSTTSTTPYSTVHNDEHHKRYGTSDTPGQMLQCTLPSQWAQGIVGSLPPHYHWHQRAIYGTSGPSTDPA